MYCLCSCNYVPLNLCVCGNMEVIQMYFCWFLGVAFVFGAMCCAHEVDVVMLFQL